MEMKTMRRRTGPLALLALAALAGCRVEVHERSSSSYPPPRRVAPAPPPPPPQQAPLAEPLDDNRYESWPPAEEQTTTIVEVEPPPPRYEVVTVCPGPSHVWVGGYWSWHNRWVWCPGRWVHGRPGHAWRSGVWVSSGHHGGSHAWSWRVGGWVRVR